MNYFEHHWASYLRRLHWKDSSEWKITRLAITLCDASFSCENLETLGQKVLSSFQFCRENRHQDGTPRQVERKSLFGFNFLRKSRQLIPKIPALASQIGLGRDVDCKWAKISLSHPRWRHQQLKSVFVLRNRKFEQHLAWVWAISSEIVGIWFTRVQRRFNLGLAAEFALQLGD